MADTLTGQIRLAQMRPEMTALMTSASGTRIIGTINYDGASA